MIQEALRIMGFGMLGIFLVMGAIAGALTLLKKIAGKKPPEDNSEQQ